MTPSYYVRHYTDTFDAYSFQEAVSIARRFAPGTCQLVSPEADGDPDEPWDGLTVDEREEWDIATSGVQVEAPDAPPF